MKTLLSQIPVSVIATASMVGLLVLGIVFSMLKDFIAQRRNPR